MRHETERARRRWRRVELSAPGEQKERHGRKRRRVSGDGTRARLSPDEGGDEAGPAARTPLARFDSDARLPVPIGRGGTRNECDAVRKPKTDRAVGAAVAREAIEQAAGEELAGPMRGWRRQALHAEARRLFGRLRGKPHVDVEALAAETAVDPSGIPPHWFMLLLESRAPFERASLRYLWNILRLAPRGDGHGVVVMPGFTGADGGLMPLRVFLRAQGFDPLPWGIGRNLGYVPGMLERLVERIEALSVERGERVSLIGYSLGGLFAREAAKLAPDAVRNVVTLASPFGGSPKANHVWRIYERTCGHKLETVDTEARAALAFPPPVPTTSIFSRSDGVINWRGCVQASGQLCENIEVISSHLGIANHPLVLYAAADRLSQLDRNWQRFLPPRALRFLFPDPLR